MSAQDQSLPDRLPIQLTLPFTDQIERGNQILLMNPDHRVLSDAQVLAGIELELTVQFGSPRPESSED